MLERLADLCLHTFVIWCLPHLRDAALGLGYDAPTTILQYRDFNPSSHFCRDTASRALLPRVFNDARTLQCILGDYQASHCSPEPSNSAFSSCRALCNSISMRPPIDSYIWSSLPATLGQRPIQASNNVTKCQRAARAGPFVRAFQHSSWDSPAC